MFSEDHYNFRFPLFVTSVHMLVQWLLASLTLFVFKGLQSPNRPQAKDYGCACSSDSARGTAS